LEEQSVYHPDNSPRLCRYVRQLFKDWVGQLLIQVMATKVLSPERLSTRPKRFRRRQSLSAQRQDTPADSTP
jgi:hypothetical protein